MADANAVTLIGNLTADPETRKMPDGNNSVTTFTLASQERRFDRAAGEFRDGEALFMRCSLWGPYGVNAAMSLHKGDRVVVLGRIKSSSYEKDGERRYSTEIVVEEVGAVLRFATARLERTARQGLRATDSGFPDMPEMVGAAPAGGARRAAAASAPF